MVAAWSLVECDWSGFPLAAILDLSLGVDPMSLCSLVNCHSPAFAIEPKPRGALDFLYGAIETVIPAQFFPVHPFDFYG